MRFTCSFLLLSVALVSAHPLLNTTVDGYDSLSSSLDKRLIKSGGCNGVYMRPPTFSNSKCWTKRGNELGPDMSRAPPGTKPKPSKAKGLYTGYWWDDNKKHTTATTDIAKDWRVHPLYPPKDRDAPAFFPGTVSF
ncbi:hypothetical protein EXIGLDRAFT_454455 [Exidia glandulosa HHB12029]|uniref:Uncharacterized protein n=1 Tax=Exidia glandulosa HHB12029 TaxID=1314781 RepID=A0A165B1V4_EXIGL|nr:hypothetical protein EXIGLDRAFT_454455 [Exidia glandulosa HHB12029]